MATTTKRKTAATDHRSPATLHVTLDVGKQLRQFVERLLSNQELIAAKLEKLLQGQEKIMAEIDDLNQKLDDITAAVSGFQDTLQTGVTAIQTEIQQLAEAVGSATDLATLKSQVAQAAQRVTPLVDSINTANQSLKDQITALNADDPVATPSARKK